MVKEEKGEDVQEKREVDEEALRHCTRIPEPLDPEPRSECIRSCFIVTQMLISW